MFIVTSRVCAGVEEAEDKNEKKRSGVEHDKMTLAADAKLGF